MNKLKCRHCGRPLTNYQIKFCSRSCAMKFRYSNNFKDEELPKSKPKAKSKPKHESISETAKKANALGMTYGKYVSKHCGGGQA